jgi:hypothetical protein
MYKCKQCNKIFNSIYAYYGHLTTCNNTVNIQKDIRFSCKYCGKIYYNGSQLGGHTSGCSLNPNRGKRLKMMHAMRRNVLNKNISISLITKKIFVGEKNPNWKGGTCKYSMVGWKEARQQVWDRDKVCRVCGKHPHKNRRLDVHHIKPRRDGGSNDIKFLVGVHHGCHIKLEANKETIKY